MENSRNSKIDARLQFWTCTRKVACVNFDAGIKVMTCSYSDVIDLPDSRPKIFAIAEFSREIPR